MSYPVISRLCKGGCGHAFTPPKSRPGQGYIHGHKNGCNEPRKQTASAQASLAAAERKTLDYKIALQTARREAESLAAQIDRNDDEIEQLRVALHTRVTAGEELVGKHLTVQTAIEVLEALVAGKSIAPAPSAEAQS